MKFVTIEKNQIGLVFKGKEMTTVLPAGKYWLGLWDTLEVFDTTAPVPAHCNWQHWTNHPEQANIMDTYCLGDQEIGIVFKNGRYDRVLTAGDFAFWKNATTNYTVERYDKRELMVPVTVDPFLLTKGLLAVHIRMVQVESYENCMLMVNGVMHAKLEPGQYFFWQNSNAIVPLKADTRQLAIEINGQELLSKDKVQLRINAILQYKIVDFEQFLLENKDADRQLYILVQLALRSHVGQLTFDELMDNKEQIAVAVQDETTQKAAALGIQITGLGVKDIILPGDIRDIMNQVLIAEKRAQANVITRREETASTRSLLNTAKLMEENAMLLKLKEMEYVEKIAEKVNTITLAGGGQVLDQLKGLFIKD